MGQQGFNAGNALGTGVAGALVAPGGVLRFSRPTARSLEWMRNDPSD
jgi:hypothetical protein